MPCLNAIRLGSTACGQTQISIGMFSELAGLIWMSSPPRVGEKYAEYMVNSTESRDQDEEQSSQNRHAPYYDIIIFLMLRAHLGYQYDRRMTSKRRCQPPDISPGRQRIERERHQVPSYKPPAVRGVIMPSDILSDMAPQMGLSDSRNLNKIREEWVVLVGDEISRNCRPGDLKSGVLECWVRHPVWMVQMQQFGKSEILRRIQAKFPSGGVREVRIRLNLEGD